LCVGGGVWGGGGPPHPPPPTPQPPIPNPQNEKYILYNIKIFIINKPLKEHKLVLSLFTI